MLLEYNTYCVWLYDENDEIIDNDIPPEWNDDQELTNAFMTVNDIYDTFFINNEKEFRYIGCKSKENTMICEQCGNEMEYFVEGSTCGAKCENCS